MTVPVAELLQLLLLSLGMVTDLTSRRIPNGLVLVLGINGLFLSAIVHPGEAHLLMSLAGGLTGLLLWWPWWLLRMLGAGDVKYFAAGAMGLGPALAWKSAMGAALLGGVYALALLRRHSRQRTATTIPTVPYAVPMGMALALALFAQHHLHA